MAILTYEIASHTQQIPLDADVTTLGRGHESTVRLRHDTEISRVHCRVEHRPDGTCLASDCDSKNGTYVNGRQIGDQPVTLKNGDQIRIGKTQLTFRESSTGQQRDGDANDAIDEVAREMESGKGYQTIFREIIPDRKRRSK